MLVLTRKQEESIVIGKDITITILAVEKDKVKIGIDAPRDIPVVRKELFEALQELNVVVEKLTEAKTPGHFESLRELLLEKTPPEEEKPDKDAKK